KQSCLSARAAKNAAAQRLLLQYRQRLEKVKDLRHQAPNFCILALKVIQRGEVARPFVGSGRSGTAGLREGKVERGSKVPGRAVELGCLSEERGGDPVHTPGSRRVIRQNVL